MLKPGSETLLTGFSLLVVGDFLAWKKNLCSYYKDDFAWVMAVRKEDQSVAVGGF